MEVYEVLEKGLSKIERPENWCQRALEKDNGRGGTAYCAIGCLTDTYKECPEATWVLIDMARRKTGQMIDVFNNSHSHAEVVALFQEAIAAEKKKAGVYIDIPTERNQELGPVKVNG